MYKVILEEWGKCLYSILKEPTAVEVDYYFDRIDDYLKALRELVDDCNRVKADAYDGKCEYPN